MDLDPVHLAAQAHRMFTVHGARMLQATLRLRSVSYPDDELTRLTLRLCEAYHWQQATALRRDVEAWEHWSPRFIEHPYYETTCPECGQFTYLTDFRVLHHCHTFGYYGPGEEWHILAWCPECDQPIEFSDGYP